MKRPVQKANGFTCFLTYVIKMIIPGKVIADPDTKEFHTANSFDGLVVHQELHVRVRVLLGSYDHDFGLAGICSKIIHVKPVVDSINVFLELRQVFFIGDGLV